MEQTSLNADSFIFLRTMRVLKPLRSIKQLPTLRLLVTSLIKAWVGLVQVYITLAFILAFYSNIGIHVFGGSEYRACRATEAPLVDPVTSEELGWPLLDEYTLCTNDEVCKRISEDSVCGFTMGLDDILNNEVLFYGVPGFNNIAQGFLTTFQVITLEGWSGLMYNYMDSHVYSISSVLFFCSLVTLGAFILLNLVLAQILDTYTQNLDPKDQSKSFEAIQQDLNEIFSKRMQDKKLRKDKLQQQESFVSSFSQSSSKSSSQSN